jgi:hypothetical protein
MLLKLPNWQSIKIIKVYLNNDGSDVDTLNIKFEDNSILQLWDDGQSCCESRYMCTDDDLTEFTNCKLIKIEVKDGGCKDDDDGLHEIQFLEITTDKGSFQMANHNEHNGYYGGFWIQAKIIWEY